LRTLPGAYAPPRGRLLLAGFGADAFAVHRITPSGSTRGRRNQAAVCAAGATRRGLGQEARRRGCSPRPAPIGYEELKLDTLDWMTAARALYEETGFLPCAPYYANPIPGVVYMSLRMRGAVGA
jgi:hypothetical protein